MNNKLAYSHSAIPGLQSVAEKKLIFVVTGKQGHYKKINNNAVEVRSS